MPPIAAAFSCEATRRTCWIDTSGYVVFGLRGEYQLGKSVRLFARIENLFDTDYESFGLLGEPDEVFPEFEDPRFLGAGPPFGAWVGVRVNML